MLQPSTAHQRAGHAGQEGRTQEQISELAGSKPYNHTCMLPLSAFAAPDDDFPALAVHGGVGRRAKEIRSNFHLNFHNQ